MASTLSSVTAEPCGRQPRRVLTIGVLVGRAYHPGWFRAFFDLVHPSAICIERSPDEFARGDFYEFTYEAQDIAIPYDLGHILDADPGVRLVQPSAYGVPSAKGQTPR